MSIILYSEYRRKEDDKWYCIGDEVSFIGTSIGFIDSIGETEEGVKIHVDLHEYIESETYGEYFSLLEID